MVIIILIFVINILVALHCIALAASATNCCLYYCPIFYYCIPLVALTHRCFYSRGKQPLLIISSASLPANANPKLATQISSFPKRINMETLFIFSCLIIFPNNSDFQFWKMSWGSFFYWPVGGVLIFLQQQIVETLKFSQFSFGKEAREE